MLKICCFLIPLLICLYSVFILLKSIFNKDRNSCDSIILISKIYIFYLIVGLFISFPGLLSLDFGFEIIIVFLSVLVGCILYLISIIICKKKKNSLVENNLVKKGNNLVLIFLPVICLISFVIRDLYLINSSNEILFFDYGSSFYTGSIAYTISDGSCNEVDLGVGESGNYIKNFIYRDFIENNDFNNYKVKIDEEEDVIFVYNNNDNLICKLNDNQNYRYVSFKKSFSIISNY